MRKHTKRLFTKLAIGTAALLLLGIPLLIWLSTSPEIAFDGETVSSDKWDDKYENSPLWEDFRQWCREQELEKPYCSIKIEDTDFREGLYEHQEYRIRVVKGLDGEVLGRSSKDAKRTVLESTQSIMIQESAIATLTTLAAENGSLQSRIAERATKSDSPNTYLRILANGRSKSAPSASILRGYMLSSAPADARLATAHTIRTILPIAEKKDELLAATPDFLASDQADIRKLGLDVLMTTGGEPAARHLATHLMSGPPEERSNALAQLIHLGPKAVSAVPSLLKVAENDSWDSELRRKAIIAVGATLTQSPEAIEQLNALAKNESLDASLRLVARNSAFVLELAENSTWTIKIEIKQEYLPESGWERMPPPEIIGALDAKIRFLPTGKMDIFNLDTKKRSKGSWNHNGDLSLKAGKLTVRCPITDYNEIGQSMTVTRDGMKIRTTWNATRDY